LYIPSRTWIDSCLSTTKYSILIENVSVCIILVITSLVIYIGWSFRKYPVTKVPLDILTDTVLSPDSLVVPHTLGHLTESMRDIIVEIFSTCSP
jgi:hypothetical protein